MRESKTGKKLEELDSVVVLLVKTKVPNKYLLVDRETGEVYQGNEPNQQGLSWRKYHTITRKELRELEEGLDQSRGFTLEDK